MLKSNSLLFDGYREIFALGQSDRSVNVIPHLHIVSNLRNRDVLPPHLPVCLHGLILRYEKNCTLNVSIQ
jgi:hypothetical protein